MSNKCRPELIKEGDFYSRISYGRIKENNFSIGIENEEGLNWTIDANIVEKEFYIHDQFTSVEEVNKTKLAEIFLRNSNIVMMVNFNKQVKEEDVINRIVDTLYANEKGKIISKDEFIKNTKTIAKEILIGENRTMIGRHYGEINDLGRVLFVDMEKDVDSSKSYDVRIRQVDPRTIQWLIVKNIKYTLK